MSQIQVINEDSNSGMKFLVTGGAGRLGTELVKLFASGGHGIVAFDLPGAFWDTVKSLDEVESVIGDVTDPDMVKGVSGYVDVVVHLAALLPPRSEGNRELTIRVNVEGTQNIVARAPGDSVAVKCHMGEWYNSAYLRPILVRVVVDRVKEHGGIPFVTDTTTAPYYFYGSRSTAQFHLETAAANGFTAESMGCPIVISDGTYGTEDIRVEIPDGILLKEGYMAKGVADADAMIVVSHFKGHGSGVYGGSIKNVAIGCSSKRRKLNVHLTTHPEVGWKTWSFEGENCAGKECPEPPSATTCAPSTRCGSRRITWSGTGRPA